VSNAVFLDAGSNARVVLPSRVVDQMHETARRAYPDETGGILIGESVGNRVVVVSDATEAPPDSKSTHSTFQRGTEGLVERLAADWGSGLYYVGEWHAHPGALPNPSCTDRRSLKATSRDASLRCPSPILVIVGGMQGRETLAVHVHWSSGGFEALSARPA